MSGEQLNPIAGILIDAHAATGEFRHTFTAEHGSPPTVATMAHHLRSVVQIRLIGDARYALLPEYVELGRVQFKGRDDGQEYVLRSSSAVSIDFAKAQRDTLFNPIDYQKSDVLMIVYEFGADSLILSIAGTRRASDRKRLQPSAAPTFVGMWQLTPTTDTPLFDQYEADVFDDLENTDAGEDGLL